METHPQVLCLQECYLTEADCISFKLPGYRLITSTPATPSRAGLPRRGSAILINSTINVKALKSRTTKLQTERELTIELIGLKVLGTLTETYTEPFEIWTAYCSNTLKEYKKFSQMLLNLERERNHRILLVGDLNHDLRLTLDPNFKSNAKHSTKSKPIAEALETLTDLSNTKILNNPNERTTKSNTVIDAAITMGLWEESAAMPIECDLRSHHFPVCVGLKTARKSISGKTTCPQYYRASKFKNTQQS